MDSSFYDFEPGTDDRTYSFISIGPRPVEKRIIYAKTTLAGFFNLALADAEEDGSLNFYSVRNNGDLELIMATVAQTLLVFFQHYPTASVAFSGSTPARTRLYQIILARERQTIAASLVISGVKNNSLEPFQPNRDYEGFVSALPISDATP
ncbi:MAG: hypothetical protein WKG07_30540 [Hymenobacter sp.]